jgi:putative membrane protein
MELSAASIDLRAGNRRAISIGALFVPLAFLLAIPASQFGPVSWHMVVHIGGMNVLMPLAAAVLAQRSMRPECAWSRPPALWAAVVAQIAVLWAMHSPSLHHALHAVPAAWLPTHALLFLVALIFWLTIANTAQRWQAMLALLLSGKFACLLGVLLIFAPRPLFELATYGSHPHPATDIALADQHLAGLLMIAACPLSYVLTALVFAVQAINHLESASTLSLSGASAGR